MKKIIASIIAGSALATSLFLTTPATAHNSCGAGSAPPMHGQGVVTFAGAYNCSPTVHDVVTVVLQAKRRQVGGSWVQVGQASQSLPNTTTATKQFSPVSWDCRKDYMSVAIGSASPGSHSGVGSSPILFHTC